MTIFKLIDMLARRDTRGEPKRITHRISYHQLGTDFHLFSASLQIDEDVVRSIGQIEGVATAGRTGLTKSEVRVKVECDPENWPRIEQEIYGLIRKPWENVVGVLLT